MKGPGNDRLEREGRALVERLGGYWSFGGGLCRCPAHEDRHPSLSVRIGRTSLLLHCFAGCPTAQVLKALRAMGQPVPKTGQSAPDPGCSRAGEARAGGPPSRLALRAWGAGGPIAGTPAELYLRSRGVAIVSDELRYLDRTPLGSFPDASFRPALIAAIRDESGLVAVQRTFLDARHGRLAAIREPRRGLGRFGAGAVRLGGIETRLGIAEGLETAISASLLFGIPCWATLGTERFGLIELPMAVGELVLFLDNDAGGDRAEALARSTFSGLKIVAHRPRRAGEDWNDVLRAQLRRCSR